MYWKTTLLALVLSAFAFAPLQAKTVSIEGDKPRERITLHVKTASVKDILKHVSQTYGIKVAGLNRLGKPDPLTITMSGKLETLIGRLLRNWNYMLVRSADRNNKSGIEKVVILNASFGAASNGGGNKNVKKSNSFSQRLKKRISANSDGD